MVGRHIGNCMKRDRTRLRRRCASSSRSSIHSHRFLPQPGPHAFACHQPLRDAASCKESSRKGRTRQADAGRIRNDGGVSGLGLPSVAAMAEWKTLAGYALRALPNPRLVETTCRWTNGSRRTPSGPAAIDAAQTGRTDDRTTQIVTSIQLRPCRAGAVHR